jgi:hypothetical protein
MLLISAVRNVKFARFRILDVTECSLPDSGTLFWISANYTCGKVIIPMRGQLHDSISMSFWLNISRNSISCVLLHDMAQHVGNGTRPRSRRQCWVVHFSFLGVLQFYDFCCMYAISVPDLGMGHRSHGPGASTNWGPPPTSKETLFWL